MVLTIDKNIQTRRSEEVAGSMEDQEYRQVHHRMEVAQVGIVSYQLPTLLSHLEGVQKFNDYLKLCLPGYRMS